MVKLLVIIIYIKLFVVRPFVTGVNRKSLDPNPRAAASLGHWRLMPLCTLAKALATGKATSELNVLDKNEIRMDTFLSEHPDGEVARFTAND